MTAPLLDFDELSSFDQDERKTVHDLVALITESDHSKRDQLLAMVQDHVFRVGKVASALASYPPVFSETRLGERERGPETLVELLVLADDASIEMYLPTRAIVGRSLVMAELNCWRLFSYICNELGLDSDHPLPPDIDYWMHSCVYTRLAEDVLISLSMDADGEIHIRRAAVDYLCKFWESRHLYGARHFFPILAATWGARRRIRVSVGTMLGVSEIMRLLQSGCDPEFVDYFSRPSLDDDEHQAFQEFLIGVSTEKIQSLAQLMERDGRKSLSPEEAGLGERDSRKQSHECVRFYEFFRSRYLQAAARRLRELPGPKKTAEEYVLGYFLDKETSGA
ncbi:MAG: hypothetical protein COB96_01325 [Planctomycetota bacterium]|jgi:hypothetical protein|nr:MAG: hypothetical protein COB96_01325 [Planctomycetota bacterium]